MLPEPHRAPRPAPTPQAPFLSGSAVPARVFGLGPGWQHDAPEWSAPRRAGSHPADLDGRATPAGPAGPSDPSVPAASLAVAAPAKRRPRPAPTPPPAAAAA